MITQMPSFLLCFATSSAVNSCVLGPEDEGALAPSAAFVEVSSEAATEVGVEDEGVVEEEGAEEGAGHERERRVGEEAERGGHEPCEGAVRDEEDGVFYELAHHPVG